LGFFVVKFPPFCYLNIVQDQVEAEHANAINTFPQTPATLGFPFGSDQLHTD